MERIEAGPFVLYTSGKVIEEWDKAVEDKIKSLGLKPGMGLRKQIEEQEKVEEIPPNKMYYDVTYEQLEKLVEEMRIKHFGR